MSTSQTVTWPVEGGGGGSGTVTSVGLSAPAMFLVSGSPVTTAGTLDFAFNAQSGNKVIASPANGSSGIPDFRALVAADIPSLSSVYLALTGGTMSGDINMGGQDITNLSQIFDTTPALSIDVSNRQLLSAAGVRTLTWEQTSLYDTSNKGSVDWSVRALYDSSEFFSGNWNLRALYDATGGASISIDWANRLLVAADGTTAISWATALTAITGNQGAANSFNTTVGTGDVADTFTSGGLTLKTGSNNGTEAYSGDLNIRTGDTSGATVNGSASGNLTISTGSSSSEYSGVITLITGATSDATKRGEIAIDAKNIAVNRPLKTNASGFLTSSQIDLASANDVTGVLPPANGGSVTGSYAQAYHDQTATWSTTSASYADPTNAGTPSLTVRQSSGITLTTAASSKAGITFAPASASAVYLITAALCIQPQNSGSSAAASCRLTDGSTVIAQGADIDQNSLAFNPFIPVTMTGIFVPGTSSSVTVKVQLATSTGTSVMTFAALGNVIEWTVLRIF